MQLFPFCLAVGRQRQAAAGTIGLSIDRCLECGAQLSFKTFRPIIPIVPCPVRESQASVQQRLHDASDLSRISYFTLLQEVILDHFAQMLLSEENRHRASL